MTAESNVRRLRDELARLRKQAAAESAKIGPARQKSAKARTAAVNARSTSATKSKTAEADREEKRAHEAEKKRGDLEKRAAKVEADLFKAQIALDKERSRAQKKAIDSLRQDAQQRNQQFSAEKSLAHARQEVVHAATGSSDEHESDIFISHASEDKDEIARPLATALQNLGVQIWFDELNIHVGSSIRRAIDHGIAKCRFGVVIISPHFIAKTWTKAELDGLYGRQMSEHDAEHFILPIWHKVTRDEVQEHLPTLAGILALNTMSYEINDLARELAKVVLPK